MRRLILTTKYKKDLKKYSHQPSKMKALLEILKLLAENVVLSAIMMKKKNEKH